VGIVFCAALLGSWWNTIRPVSLGGPMGYVLVRGVSMLPTFHTGDLVLTRREHFYRTGDIVAYRVPKGDFGSGTVVIHRIMGGSDADGYTTKGDNNAFLDDWHPRVSDIVGRAWVRVDRVGSWLAALRAPLPLAAAAATFVIVMVLLAPSRRSGNG
jgi:signal peptidase